MEESLDFSNAFEKLQEMLSSENGQEQIQNILGMFTGGQNDFSDAPSDINLPSLLSGGNHGEAAPDLDMLFKLQKIMSLMKNQKNTPQTDFLCSLKPFLTSKRQHKVDTAIKLLGAIKVMKILKAMDGGGD